MPKIPDHNLNFVNGVDNGIAITNHGINGPIVHQPPVVTQDLTTSATHLSQHAVADEFVTVLENMVHDAVRKNAPSYILCEVLEKTSNSHYNVYVVPDTTQVLTNIVNNTPYNLNRGDLVYICKMNQNLSTAYIAAKIIPYAQDKAAISIGEGSMNSAIGSNYIYYKNSRWKLVFSDSFFAQLQEARTRGLYRKIRIGISRVMGQHSSAGRCRWIDQKRMKSKAVRRSYSVPDYVGVQRIDEFGRKLYWAPLEERKKKAKDAQGKRIYVTDPGRYRLYPIIDEVYCCTTVDIPVVDISGGNEEVLIPEIDITDIVNNFLFCDDYNVRRSWRKGKSPQWDTIQKTFNNYGYWYKRFGIYIRACNSSNDLIFLTPKDQTYTTRVYSLSPIDGKNYTQYNVNNIKILGGSIIALNGNFTTPYQPQGEYHKLDPHEPINVDSIYVSPTSAKENYVPHILVNFTDSAHDTPGESYVGELPIDRFDTTPVIKPGDRFVGGVTYTFVLKGSITPERPDGIRTTVTIPQVNL